MPKISGRGNYVEKGCVSKPCFAHMRGSEEPAQWLGKELALACREKFCRRVAG